MLHQVKVVKRQRPRPYQKIKSSNSETFEVNKYIRFKFLSALRTLCALETAES
jgi:hypothetical protein